MTTKKLTFVWLALGVAVLLSGCAVHVRPTPVRVQAKAVRIEAGHQHSARCGHVRDGGRWLYIRGHVHKRGCGHVHRGGVWVVRR